MDKFTLAFAYLNGFAVLLLILALSNYRRKFKYICCEEKIFIFLVLSNILVLVIEVALKMLWLKEGAFVHGLLYAVQILDFEMVAIIPLLWLLYCIYRIYQNITLKARFKILLAAPAVLFLLFMVLPIIWGQNPVFRITEINKYARGPYFYVSIIAAYIYIVSSIVLIVAKRKVLSKGELFPYLLLPSVPIILGLLESLISIPVSLTWSATSLVFMGIQVHILNKKTNIDHLTSLNNRMALDGYIKRLISESHYSKDTFGIIMLDIDDFKKVNDLYGHTEGDKALKTAANILCEVFSGKNFLARYGGDEFTVVIKDCDQKMLDEYLMKLEKLVETQNQTSSKPYKLRFSIGAYIFRHNEITDVHTMLMRVDNIMYEHKNAKKQRPVDQSP